MIKTNKSEVTMSIDEFIHMVNFGYKKGWEAAGEVLKALNPTAGLDDEQKEQFRKLIMKDEAE